METEAWEGAEDEFALSCGLEYIGQHTFLDTEAVDVAIHSADLLHTSILDVTPN